MENKDKLEVIIEPNAEMQLSRIKRGLKPLKELYFNTNKRIGKRINLLKKDKGYDIY